MVFVKTGLLKEYMLANNALKWMTRGSKCNWNPKTQQFKLNKKPHIICLILGLLFGQAEIITIIRTLVQGKSYSSDENDERKKFKTVEMIMASGKAITYISACLYLKHRKTQETFFNNLISVENRFLKNNQGLTSLEKRKVNTAKLACYTLRVSGIKQLGILFAVVGMLLPKTTVNMFSYPLASYMLIYMDNILHQFGIYWKFAENWIIFLANYVVWSIHLKNLLLAAIEKIIGSVCLTLAILQFEREWKESDENYMKTCRFYRSIQLLTDMFNDVEATQLVMILVTFGIAQVSACLAILGGSNVHESMPTENAGFMVWVEVFHYVILGNTVVVINFLYGYCAQVHDTSKKVLEDLLHRRPQDKGKNKMHKKLLQSLPVVAAKFGMTNYIEKLTPVVFQVYFVERIADALLVQR